MATYDILGNQSLLIPNIVWRTGLAMPMSIIVLFQSHTAGLEADCAEHGLAYPGQSTGPLLTRLNLDVQ
jgi:hypothetical protein